MFSKLIIRVSASRKLQSVVFCLGFAGILFVILILNSDYHNTKILKLLPHLTYMEQNKMVSKGNWPTIINALYNTLSGPFFVISLAFLLLPIFIGDTFSTLKEVLSSSFFRPLAKIGLSVYLVHMLVLFYIYFSEYTLVYFSHNRIIYIFLSSTMIIYAIGMLLAITVEYPFRTLFSTIICPLKRHKKKLGGKLERVLGGEAINKSKTEGDSSSGDET
jgi:hypothetical protein